MLPVALKSQGEAQIEPLPLLPRDKQFLELKEWWLNQLILCLGVPSSVPSQQAAGGDDLETPRCLWPLIPLFC